MSARRWARLAFLLPLLWASPASADLIDELVAEVSMDRLTAHIDALEYPRYFDPDLDRAAAYISKQFELCGYEVVHQPLYSSENVIARLPGTMEPERILVIGAHYDTVVNSPGADDNASGVAAVLEIARILSGMSLPYAIEFVAFTFEELWMVGSFHYVSQAQAQGLDILGMINFDMIGYTCGSPGCQQPFWDIGGCFQVDPDGVNVGRYAATLVNDASAELLASCSFAAGSYVPELEVVTMQVVGNGDCFGFTRRSDHVPFWEAGIPALEFLNTYGSRNPYYHTPNDLLATLDMEFCLRVTRTALALAMLTEQAGMPEVPTTLAFSTLDGALPNPCSGEARIRFALPRAGTLALRIHDVTGRRLRTLAAGLWGEGTHELSWDGRDDTGRRLGGGAYFISLETAGQRLTRRLVLAE